MNKNVNNLEYINDYVNKTFSGIKDERELKEILKLSQLHIILYLLNRIVTGFMNNYKYLIIIFFVIGIGLNLLNPESPVIKHISDMFLGIMVYTVLISPFIIYDIKKYRKEKGLNIVESEEIESEEIKSNDK